MKNSIAVYFFPFLLFLSGCHSRAPLRVTDLRCEYVVRPAGLDVAVRHPRLSWRLPLLENDQRQTAWQVVVATSPALLNPKDADLWNSGKVVSGQSTQISYGGKPVPPCTEVWWQVRVWDRHGRLSAWSTPARWETGLDPAGWQAVWIGSPVEPPSAPGGPNPAYYFRREITLPAAPRRARAYISGLGYYELYINGEKVGDHLLSPNHSNYGWRDTSRFPFREVRHMASRVYYETFDITPYLQEGTNTVGVILGNGWFFQHERAEDTSYTYGLPRLIAQLDIDAGDTSLTLVTDTLWRTSTGPLLHNGIYTGEIYDARREMPGWARPAYDDSRWQQAVRRPAPGGRLTGQTAPPDRMIREVKPVAVKRLNDTTLQYDMGEMISGWVRLYVQGKRGTPVTLKFIEEQGPQYGQTDTYILKGGGPEEWQPRFTWHAFRYVKIISPTPPDTLQVTGVVVNTDVPVTGHFECSSNLFTRINENFIRTQQGNMHGGVPSDCPHRERRGYTGDGQIAARAAIYNFDMSAFYTKWIEDIADGQNKVTGFVPYTVPFQGGWGGTPWGSAYIILPWYMYLYYGDTAVVKKHWEGMKKYIGYLEGRLKPPGIVDEHLLGEWVPPQPNNLPEDLVSTAYFHHDLQIMKHLAGVLDRKDEAAYFDSLALLVRKGFHKAWFHKEEMSYATGRQGANVFALGYDMVPEQYVKGVFRTLVSHLINDTEGHFDTGMMGTPLLLQVLARYGRNDLAFSLMNQKDFPSFGLEIFRGSTTLWETWDGHLSHSHPMFGSVCAWFYNTLAGINPDPAAPGYRHIIIHPQPVADLGHVSAACRSPYGTITSSWQQQGDDLILEVNIPPNTTATVMLPARDGHTLTATGRYGQPGIGITFAGVKDHTATWHILSGNYRFVSEKVRSLIPHSLLTAPIVRPGDTLLYRGNSLTVTMHSGHDKAFIRYTLDGTLPDSTATLYTRPLILTGNTRLRARVYRKGYRAGPVTKRTYAFIDPARNGLNYTYYPGLWEKVPDFSDLSPAARGVLHQVNLGEIPYNKDRFALHITSHLLIPATGEYTFFLSSNDGSRLWIDGKEVVDNDGPHPARERKGTIFLTKGRHLLTIGYMQVGGGYFLSLGWKGPGIAKETVPPDRFFF